MIAEVIKMLQAEVQTLTHELTVTLPEALEKAIALGDLKENGDYHAALERQQFVQGRLGHLTQRLTKLSQIDVSKIPTDRVGLGSRLVVRDMATKEDETFELVIADAMDLGQPLSVNGPVRRATQRIAHRLYGHVQNGNGRGGILKLGRKGLSVFGLFGGTRRKAESAPAPRTVMCTKAACKTSYFGVT